VLLRNRPLLLAILALFAAVQFSLGGEIIAARFDWRPLWGAPIVKGTMMDFTFTVLWCGLYVLDSARRRSRSGWAWIPLLLIFPTVALFLFSLTDRAPQDHDTTA
jgi:hypothetical protein